MKRRVPSWIIVIIMIMIVYGVPFLALAFISQVVIKPPVSPIYTPRNIETICRKVPIMQSYEFCSESSGLNDVKLNQLVRELFPAQQAHYTDVVRHLGYLKSNWSADCEGIKTSFDYALNNCPMPQFCEGTAYGCSFMLPDSSTLIYVSFDMATGVVLNIYVPTPGDS